MAFVVIFYFNGSDSYFGCGDAGCASCYDGFVGYSRGCIVNADGNGFGGNGCVELWLWLW